MQTDFVDIEKFYQTQLGLMAQDLLRKRVQNMWRDLRDERVAPLGASGPLLGSYPVVSARMTSSHDETFSCLVDSHNKPLPDNDLDRILALHAIDSSSDIDHFLREAWRTLKGEGRLLIIVPRQGSPWAKAPDTPFGRERAFSRGEIKKIMANQGFIVTRLKHALYPPPRDPFSDQSSANRAETIASWLLFHRGGSALLVEAQKRIPGLISVKNRHLKEAAVPLYPDPQPI